MKDAPTCSVTRYAWWRQPHIWTEQWHVVRVDEALSQGTLVALPDGELVEPLVALSRDIAYRYAR